MRIYTVTDGDGKETQIQSDNVEIQSMHADGTVLYRFVDDPGDSAVTVAFITGDDQTRITSIPG